MRSGCAAPLRWSWERDGTGSLYRCCISMNQPKVQTDVPAEGASPDANPTGTTPHGIPEGMEKQEAKATPTSDRGATETAPLRVGKD